MRGSSPRVRGTHSAIKRFSRTFRFIPACAGNTIVLSVTRSGIPVHPRVCGEHGCGSYRCLNRGGSSPRVRGTHRLRPDMKTIDRFIPACAGNTIPKVVIISLIWVHPRVCGEHEAKKKVFSICGGSSPRVRGTHPYRNNSILFLRFIPACAGNTSNPAILAIMIAVHPRVCGEHILWLSNHDCSLGSSPRVRGTRWFLV